MPKPENINSKPKGTRRNYQGQVTKLRVRSYGSIEIKATQCWYVGKSIGLKGQYKYKYSSCLIMWKWTKEVLLFEGMIGGLWGGGASPNIFLKIHMRYQTPSQPGWHVVKYPQGINEVFATAGSHILRENRSLQLKEHSCSYGVLHMLSCLVIAQGFFFFFYRTLLVYFQDFFPVKLLSFQS